MAKKDLAKTLNLGIFRHLNSYLSECSNNLESTKASVCSNIYTHLSQFWVAFKCFILANFGTNSKKCYGVPSQNPEILHYKFLNIKNYAKFLCPPQFFNGFRPFHRHARTIFSCELQSFILHPRGLFITRPQQL